MAAISQSKELVESIIDAHGGLEAYAKVDSIETKFDFTGFTLALKKRPHLHLTPSASISTKEQKVTFRDLGVGVDEQWIFTPEKVYKQRVSDNTILSFRENPREAFANHKLDTPWDDFHLLYFSGYALWQYFHFPYLLARKDVSTRQLEPHQEAGQTWSVLEVTFPDPFIFAAHERVQTYYFNEQFMLQRHDYAPDVIARNPAAHYSFDPVTVGELKFASLRRVVGMGPAVDGTLIPLVHGPIPTLIHLIFFSIELKDGSDSQAGKWSLASFEN